MTTNQSNQLATRPNTKKAIMVLKKFAAVEADYKAAEKEAKEATELIKNAMIEAGVPKIEINLPNLTGYITLAERVNYKVEGDTFNELWEELLDILRNSNIPGVDSVGLADRMKYIKPALDTDKVKAERTLTGDLPAGVVESKTQYITKKFKAVE